MIDWFSNQASSFSIIEVYFYVFSMEVIWHHNEQLISQSNSDMVSVSMVALTSIHLNYQQLFLSIFLDFYVTYYIFQWYLFLINQYVNSTPYNSKEPIYILQLAFLIRYFQTFQDFPNQDVIDRTYCKDFQTNFHISNYRLHKRYNNHFIIIFSSSI